MIFKKFLPDEKLRAVIKHYWLMEMDHSNNGTEEILFPAGAIEIVLHLKSSFLRLTDKQWAPERKAFIEGQQSGIVIVKSMGEMKTIGITLYPWATSVLYKMPPGFFTDKRLSVAKIDPTLKNLYKQLYAKNEENQIPELCNRYFLSILKNRFVRYSPAEMVIMDIFKKQDECLTTLDMKKEWNYSTKLFERKFKEMAGLPAGELLKKRRMIRVLKKTLLNDYKSFTEVAHSAGYYDQSHFIKDFRNYFLSSPKLLKKEHSLLKHFI